MTLAIRGDRTSSLWLQLGPRTWVLAVARGFGSVGGQATEAALLSRLRTECGRRIRGARFRRAIDRPHTAATAMLAVLTRVNGDLYASTASHDDYVTAAASLTAAVIVQGYAYVLHSGATAAYLAREGDVIALSTNDVFDEDGVPLLGRAVGVAPVLDVAISSAMLAQGDSIVLLGRRLRGDAERRTLIAHLDASDPGDHVLIARFERDDAGPADTPPAPAYPCASSGLFARCAAAIAFLTAAIFTR